MTLFSLVAKAWFALSIASLASPAHAQDSTDASIFPADWPRDIYANSVRQLTLTTIAGDYEFDVAPLTIPALPDVNGDLVILDHTNFVESEIYAGKVIYLSCDADPASNLTPSDILNVIMDNSQPPNAPEAILLHATQKHFCQLGGSHTKYTNIWSMVSTNDAIIVRNFIRTSQDSVKASITSNMPTTPNPPGLRPGNSTIAMSILYSITGLITLLFLLIIATGAVRAHRNPERYGPRTATNGRPRRSRARGLAMAMLETLPIVKFGENDSRKPDEENRLETVTRVEPQQQEGSRPREDGASNDTTVPRPSPETGNDVISEHEPPKTPTTVTTTPGKANNEPALEGSHLGCSICTEDFTVGEDVRVLPCNHKFHPACVDPWLVNVSGTCPLCRLDLRPAEDIAAEAAAEAARQQNLQDALDGPAATHGHLAPPVETEPQAPGSTTAAEATQRRRRSRLLDWNRLRHAPVDERILALREYRESQDQISADDIRYSRITERLRGRFHSRGDSRNSVTAPPGN